MNIHEYTTVRRVYETTEEKLARENAAYKKQNGELNHTIDTAKVLNKAVLTALQHGDTAQAYQLSLLLAEVAD